MQVSAAQKPALYLDIDGVLLRRTGTQTLGAMSHYEIAIDAEKFLEWATGNFDTFWLSARTSDGESANAERAFRHASPKAMQTGRLRQLITQIPAVQWRNAKLNGIDLKRPFLWVDDAPDPLSIRRLKEIDLITSLIEVSYENSPRLLKKLPTELEKRMHILSKADPSTY